MLHITVRFEVLPRENVLIIWVVIRGTLRELRHHRNRSRNFLPLIFGRSLILSTSGVILSILLNIIWPELLELALFKLILSCQIL